MNIYILKNFTLREQYFGQSESPSREAALEQKTNPLSPVGHWQWGKEKIQWGEVQGGLAPASASAFLKALRNEPPEAGWVNVFGGDDLAPPDDSPDEEEWLPPPE